MFQAGCKEQLLNSGAGITIKLEVDPNAFTILTDVFMNPKIVRLETPKNVLVGTVEKIIISDKYYFLLDNRNAMGVFVFDLSGKYIASIQERGKGPGQYYRPNDFAVDMGQQEIHIYSNNNKKILIYSFSGKFLREKRLNSIYANDFCIDALGRYVFSMQNSKSRLVGSNYNLIIADRNAKTLVQAFRFEKGKENYSFGSAFTMFGVGERRFYIPPYSYKVFDVSESIKCIYQFDFGKRNVPESLYQQRIKEDALMQEINTKGYCRLWCFYENSHYVVCQFLCSRRIMTAIYSKATAHSKVFAGLGGDGLIRTGVTVYGLTETDEILYSVDASVVAGEVIPASLSADKTSAQIKEADNPLLMLYQIKSF